MLHVKFSGDNDLLNLLFESLVWHSGKVKMKWEGKY